VRINDATQVDVLSMSSVPVFRAQDGTRVFASAPAFVEHVSCLHVAKAAEVFFLKSLAAERVAAESLAVESLMGTGMASASELSPAAGVALEGVQLRGPVLIQDPVQGYGQAIERQAKGGLTSSNGTGGFSSAVHSTTSTNGTKSTNPIDPWDLRTSSPPG
jgi:hypothetical protein